MLTNVDFPKNEKALTRKQETFIAACLTLPTTEAAARAAGVSGKTGRLWLKEDKVQQALAQARDAAFSHALQVLADVTEEAIGFLCSKMRDPETSDGMRIRAAAVLLEKSLEIHLMRELKAEFAAIKLLTQGSSPGRKFGI